MKVKSQEILSQVLGSDLLHPELKAKLVEVVRNEVTTKPRKFSIWNYVAENDIRPYFEGLYQDVEECELREVCESQPYFRLSSNCDAIASINECWKRKEERYGNRE